MKKYRIFSLICFFMAILAYSQKVDTIATIGELKDERNVKMQVDKDGRKYYWDDKLQAKIYTEDNGDKLIEMDEIKLVNKPHFNNQLDRNYFEFLNKKLFRVYPLFVNALEQYRSLQADLEKVNEDDRRSYARKRQNELADRYEAKLRDLTTTEGQVFAKLMNRATGKTVFTIIRDLRGGWSAFWWNLKGKAADIELKKEYNPYLNRDDEFIESLLQSNWNYGYLTPYPGYKDFKVKKSVD
ncbi:DUF4294 domain-containing protein [Elizabethkingia occulta]|uniref:Molecular chaperone DnaJ n=1 Tax=Elizabethkingia occulta TaxID=1867263 RepID=A0A1T3MVJ1_9FLAO|nr:DUF4294 domain-containing protein [Elizabethkingia occulta]OPB95223.1 molecular chaperone DnaJ [Elizabethkingia occulta]OPC68331.1 molecular chaperone DnaJ [Elizabethkingia occulta]